jgi:hypothetical protein
MVKNKEPNDQSHAFKEKKLGGPLEGIQYLKVNGEASLLAGQCGNIFV